MITMDKDKQILKLWLKKEWNGKVNVESFRELIRALIVAEEKPPYEEVLKAIAIDLELPNYENMSIDELEKAILLYKNKIMEGKPKPTPWSSFILLTVGGIAAGISVSIWTFAIAKPSSKWFFISTLATILSALLLLWGAKKIPKEKRKRKEIVVQSIDDIVYAFERIDQLKKNSQSS